MNGKEFYPMIETLRKSTGKRIPALIPESELTDVQELGVSRIHRTSPVHLFYRINYEKLLKEISELDNYLNELAVRVTYTLPEHKAPVYAHS